MDYFEPKTIVIAVTTMVFLAIVLDILRRKKRSRYENLQMSSRDINRSSRFEYEEDPFSDSQFPSGGARVVGTRDDDYSAPIENEKQKSLFEQPKQGKFNWDDAPIEQEVTPINIITAPEKQAVEIEEEQAESPEVLIIHLMTAKDQVCNGQLLLDTSVSLGLRYGNMKIFHRHTSSDGSGPVLFSMANLLKPGTFDLNTIAQQEMIGVTLFMAPSELDKPTEIFDLMLEIAEKMAKKLQLNIMDETRSSMTKQTIDHYRHRAQRAVLLQERSG